MQNFQLLVIFAVKICRQCLQTVPASGEIPRLLPSEAWSINTLGDFCRPNYLGCNPHPPMKIPGGVTHGLGGLWRQAWAGGTLAPGMG